MTVIGWSIVGVFSALYVSAFARGVGIAEPILRDEDGRAAE